MHALNLHFRALRLLPSMRLMTWRDLEGGLTDGNPVRALLRAGLRGRTLPDWHSTVSPIRGLRAGAREAGITVVTADEVYARGVDAAVRERLNCSAPKRTPSMSTSTWMSSTRLCARLCRFAAGGPTLDVEKSGPLCGAHPSVRIIDIVEVDPTKDERICTALAAASFFLAFASGVAERVKL